MKIVAVFGMLGLVACSPYPGPSVPMQQGKSLTSARDAVKACAVHAPQGGADAVFGGYLAGVLLGGVIVGPIVVAANQRGIEGHGQADAVDRCLAKRGFVRRDLTHTEVAALDRADAVTRTALLNHLVSGGTLATFPGIRVVEH
ncbi:MAG: hypothetical protein ACK4VZ_04485 [Paracoccaceae bacterium]